MRTPVREKMSFRERAVKFWNDSRPEAQFEFGDPEVAIKEFAEGVSAARPPNLSPVFIGEFDIGH